MGRNSSKSKTPSEPLAQHHTGLEFGAGSGSLPRSKVGAGEVTGRWKVLGYEAQELTQVMNP